MRGLAGQFPLDEKAVYVVGRSLARQMSEKLGRKPRFITGRDTRESGEWIERAFHAGAHAEDADCQSAEIITTPGVAFLTKNFGFDAGIVISASHNPYHDNGIKVFSPTGKKIDSETERAIEKDIFQEQINVNADFREDKFDVSMSADYQTAYLDYLTGEFAELSLEKFKIVIDCAHGAASHLAPKLFAGFGAEVIAINCRPNGRNINENCGSLHLEGLRAKVLAEKADFGVAFDGDADRALFIDEKGNLVDGDVVLWIMSQMLSENGKLTNQTVVATVMSNLGLEVALNSKNIKLLRTPVGDKYVLEELLRTNSAVGGEQSGHIIFPEKSLVGDGLMTALFVLEAIWEKGVKFSEMTQGFIRYPQTLVNVKVRQKRPFEEVPEISEAVGKLEKELGSKGRLLLRYSGTENLARVMIEGENQEKIDFQARQLAEIIRKSLG